MTNWEVNYHDDFYAEVLGFEKEVQTKLAAMAKVLETFGPQLGRPKADTLKGSKHPNMKELRFKVGKQALRVAFAFDPHRTAILLAGGDKQGEGEQGFYGDLIKLADTRYDGHLKST